jgi:hypothetical protein
MPGVREAVESVSLAAVFSTVEVAIVSMLYQRENAGRYKNESGVEGIV